MEFYLLRHGKTKYNGNGLLLGKTDIGLMDKNDPELLKWAPYLKQKPIKQMISSGLKRTEESLLLIRQHLGRNIPYSADERLRELDFGDWELKSYDWLYQNERELFEKWLADPFFNPPPRGETLTELKERLISFFEDWAVKQDKDSDDALEVEGSDDVSEDDSVLIVTHGGPIQVLWSLFHHVPFYEKQVQPASLFYLNWNHQSMFEIKSEE